MFLTRLLFAILCGFVFVEVVGCCFGCPSTNSEQRCTNVGTNGHRPASASAPQIWIGTDDANDNYKVITPNATLPIQHGPQGGEHVWGAAQLYAPKSSADWTLTFQIKGSDGKMIAEYEDIVAACDTDLAETRHVTVRFNDFVAPTNVSGAILMVDATPDGGKTTVHDEVPISWM